MNKILIFLLCMIFGISIAFPILYIYRPVFIKCYKDDKKKAKKKSNKENLLIGFYTVIFSLIFTIVYMSLGISIQLKCF